MKATPKSTKKTPNFATKGGPAAVAKGPSTPIGKGIVEVRNSMPKAK
jgi:hypothetical protein